MQDMIVMEDIIKRFYVGTPNELTILKGISLRVAEAEFVSIVGASGSGKSTLMNIIGVLDRPTSGSYRLGSLDTEEMNANQQAQVRSTKIGFVFQNFNLVPRMTAVKNVELPLFYRGVGSRKRAAKARELMALVGMGDRLDHLPSELSGGQKQRVAIARAMANDPDIILADEPTGALDTDTGHMIMALFHTLHREHGKTIILITHNPELAAQTGRVITLSDGKITGQQRPGRQNFQKTGGQPA